MSILSNSGIAAVPFTGGMLILESGPASGFDNVQATQFASSGRSNNGKCSRRISLADKIPCFC